MSRQSIEELCWCSLKRGFHQRGLSTSLTKILHFWSSSHYFTLGGRGKLKYFSPACVARPLRSSRCSNSASHWSSSSRGVGILASRPLPDTTNNTNSLLSGSPLTERRSGLVNYETVLLPGI